MGITARHVSAALILAGSLLAAGCGSSDTTSPTTSAAPTTAPAGSTTTQAPASTGTTTTTVPSDAQPDTAVWPFAGESTRFSDPVAAASGFATTFLGFVDPVVGPFQQGDTRSGEVAVQATADGPVTTVFVRQLQPDDSWWVLGAATANLELSSPETLGDVASPVEITGRSTAFEATINIEIRADGQAEPLATGIAMGGANGEMGPFATSLSFPTPTATGGAIVVKTISPRDGNIAEASVIRVRFS